MLNKVWAGLLLAMALLAQPAPSAAVSLDKPALEAYFRHLLLWPPSVDVVIGDPTASPMPGFYRVNVHGTLGDKTRDEAFYVSADSKTVIRGEILDVTKNPFQSVIDSIKTDNQPFLGVPGAPVTIAEFADFECPYCRQEAAVVRTQLMDAFPGQIQLFYMDYPLSQIHPYARAAAILGRCVYDQSNASFWKYHDWIFEHQSDITKDNLGDKVLAYAKTDPALDSGKLAACAFSSGASAAVDRTEALGDSLGLTATPSFFINGRRMVGAVGFDDLKMVVAHEIAWAQSRKKAADCCSVQLSLPGMAPAAAPAEGTGKTAGK